MATLTGDEISFIGLIIDADDDLVTDIRRLEEEEMIVQEEFIATSLT